MAKYMKTEDGYQEIETTVSSIVEPDMTNKMDKNNPVGTGSFSMGRKVGSVIGNFSHAEGQSTTASGYYSHAEGQSTTASGYYSHAEGQYTTASSYHSHAEGQYTTASGSASHAEGRSTTASGIAQHVQGKYNVEDSEGKYAHIVGNGTDDDKRSNAHTLDWEGNAWFAGEVKVGGTGQNDYAAKTLATTEDIPVVDGTLTQSGQAADAKAVGDRLSTLSEEIVTASESKVAAHNTGTDTHSDIRLLIQGLTDRLNALADSDDTTLDQMSEVVAYIKSNKSLIDAITTSKVSVADIVDNLITNVSNKPLSAAQGVAIKTLIDALRNDKLDAAELTNAINTALAQAKASGEFDGVDGKSAYAYAAEGGFTGTEAEFAAKLAAEKFANPNALTFTGAVTGSYDGSAPLSVEIPSGGGGGGGSSGGSGKAKSQILIDQEITELTASLSVNLEHNFHNLTAIINCGSAGVALTAGSDGTAVESKIGLLIDTTSFGHNSRKVSQIDTNKATWQTRMIGAEWSDDLAVFKRGFAVNVVTTGANNTYNFNFGGVTAMYGTLGTDDNAPRTGKTANIVVNGAYLNVGTKVVLWGEYYE